MNSSINAFRANLLKKLNLGKSHKSHPPEASAHDRKRKAIVGAKNQQPIVQAEKKANQTPNVGGKPPIRSSQNKVKKSNAPTATAAMPSDLEILGEVARKLIEQLPKDSLQKQQRSRSEANPQSGNASVPFWMNADPLKKYVDGLFSLWRSAGQRAMKLDVLHEATKSHQDCFTGQEWTHLNNCVEKGAYGAYETALFNKYHGLSVLHADMVKVSANTQRISMAP